MKKCIVSLLVFMLIFGLAGCNKGNSPDISTPQESTSQQISDTKALSDEKLIAVVAEELDVPNETDLEYSVSEMFYWDSAERYFKNVTFTENGKIVAGASVDPYTGELLRNIFKYQSDSTPTETQSTEALKPDDIVLEKYVGIWRNDHFPPDALKITSNGNGEIECSFELYRLATFHLVLTVQDGEVSFTDKYNRISGKMAFSDNSVLLTIVESGTDLVQKGAEYLFANKTEMN